MAFSLRGNESVFNFGDGSGRGAIGWWGVRMRRRLCDVIYPWSIVVSVRGMANEGHRWESAPLLTHWLKQATEKSDTIGCTLSQLHIWVSCMLSCIDAFNCTLSLLNTEPILHRVGCTLSSIYSCSLSELDTPPADDIIHKTQPLLTHCVCELGHCSVTYVSGLLSSSQLWFTANLTIVWSALHTVCWNNYKEQLSSNKVTILPC